MISGPAFAVRRSLPNLQTPAQLSALLNTNTVAISITLIGLHPISFSLA
ncbi:hypothetical protein BRCON_1550 [Candidatus Sumerlaea chitinivorans]|uniref:Uncharacterized protein n=1 Tax=Sumerlaea chitinivorans TaxID=2250252 RepID=A0A2Z4Y543_SUMC1|nr:hypothetical protein BRCON_1550 [Candidatus Sumerlaea chitinivorans]